MRTLILFFVALSWAQLAHSLERWDSTKYIYSLSDSAEYSMQLTLNLQDEGRVVTRNGAAKVRYEVLQSGEIVVTLMEPVSYSTMAFKEVRPGQFEPVEMVNTLKSFFLSDDFQVRVIETWDACYEYEFEPEEVTKRCEEHERVQDQGLVIRDELNQKDMMVKEGDKVFLPYVDNTDLYLRLLKDGSIEMIQGPKDKMKVVSWFKEQGNLVLTRANGSTVRYTAVKDIEAIQRVVGVLTPMLEQQDSKIFNGAMAIDRQLDMSSMTMDQASGSYLTVLASSMTQGENLTTYDFDKDGFGGFKWSYGENESETRWIWKVENGEMVAKRYRHMQGQMVVFDENLEKCEAKIIRCMLFQVRRYKIIEKTGNRFTMIRTMQMGFDENGVSSSEDLSVWTFYKR